MAREKTPSAGPDLVDEVHQAEEEIDRFLRSKAEEAERIRQEAQQEALRVDREGAERARAEAEALRARLLAEAEERARSALADGEARALEESRRLQAREAEVVSFILRLVTGGGP